MTAEEQRAADYRTSQLARATATVARIAGLAGSVTARAALQAAWAPVLTVSGPLVPIARGMYVDETDLQDPDAGCEPVMPFTEQLA